MTEKTIQQLMADPIFNDYEIAVSAEWLQDKLREREQLERAVINLHKRIDILEARIAFEEAERPMYRLNIKG